MFDYWPVLFILAKDCEREDAIEGLGSEDYRMFIYIYMMTVL